MPFLLLCGSLLLLSYNYGNELNEEEHCYILTGPFAGQEAEDLSDEPTITKDPFDANTPSREFIRNRSTFDWHMRNVPASEGEMPAPPPVQRHLDQQYCGDTPIQPAYYTFLFRYKPF